MRPVQLRGSRSGIRFWSALPAALALLAGLAPARAAAAGSGAGHASHRADADGYVLTIGNRMTSTNLSLDEYEALRERHFGDFLWFRRAGKTYLIEDRGTLEECRSFFAPLRALEPEREDLQRREEALDEREAELDREEEDLDVAMDRLDDIGDDEGEDQDATRAAPASDAELRALRSRQENRRDQQRDLEARSRELEQAEKSLDGREEAIEAKAEAKVWNLIDAAVRSGIAKPTSVR